MNEHGNGFGTHTFDGLGSALPIYTNPAATSAAGDAFNEDWSFAVPANIAPGSYSESFTYLAVGA